jgi:hypothetical protein
MDWFILLAPIALLLILLPLPIVGCALDTAGTADAPNEPSVQIRLVRLLYDSGFREAENERVISISATFKARNNGTPEQVISGLKPVKYEDGNVAEGSLAKGPAAEAFFTKFSLQELISCECTANITIEKKQKVDPSEWPILILITGETNAPTENETIEFELLYSALYPIQEYDPDNFGVYFKG